MHNNTPTQSRRCRCSEPKGVPIPIPIPDLHFHPGSPTPWPLSDVSIVCSCSPTSVRMLNNISPLRNNGTSRLSPTSSTFYLWHQFKVLLFMLARCSGKLPSLQRRHLPPSRQDPCNYLKSLRQLLLPTFVGLPFSPCGKFLLSLIVRRGKS